MQSISRRSFIQSAGGVVLGTTLANSVVNEGAYKKTVIDRRFVAEGVCFGDVNRKGNLDIIAGNCWYEAPYWTPHEIAPFRAVDPATAYSNCFNSWAVDLDHDGWIDQLVIGMPGERALWRQNPRGKREPWREHPVWPSACNESPLYVDLFGSGKRVLVMGYDDSVLAWFEPERDPFQEWRCHNVSGKNGKGAPRYAHGLGVGDINGDGRNEIIVREGYYLMPDDPHTQEWKFVPADLGPECAQMHVIPSPSFGFPGLVTSSAHNRGVWWYEQVAAGKFVQHLIDDAISETHALVKTTINRRVNFVTGKRTWAHGPHGDVGANEPAWLVRYELREGPDGPRWLRHLVDDASGVGTQFVVTTDRRPGMTDIAIANKNGVFLFEQMF